MQHGQSNPSIVRLNIGGNYFTTSLQTLTKDPNSMLATMFSGKFEMIPSQDGTFFIDRDGTHFRFILNYLRTGTLTLPEGATFLKELAEEADYYNIEGILIRLNLLSEILTNEEHITQLLSWLPFYGAGIKRHRLRLLFRASRDGFTAQTFHSKCDNKGPTVTIVKSGENIFGGFTKASWKSQSSYSRCTEAFLFSMVNPQRLEPTKMPISSVGKKHAIFYRDDYGPTFGAGLHGGHALKISDHANVCANYFGITDTYEFHQLKEFPILFTGERQFIVTDYEVFSLVN